MHSGQGLRATVLQFRSVAVNSAAGLHRRSIAALLNAGIPALARANAPDRASVLPVRRRRCPTISCEYPTEGRTVVEKHEKKGRDMKLSVAQVRTDRRSLLVVLGCLTAIEVAAIDVYMPALPRFSEIMHISAPDTGLTLAVFLAGLAVGQAICGPLSDRYGRRKPLIAGLCLYAAASLMPLVLPSLGWFLFARILQALGAAAGLVISRAVVTDCFTDAESPRIFSVLQQILGITATVAPILGGFLLAKWDWPSIPIALAGIGVISLLMVVLSLPETLPPQSRVSGRLSAQVTDCIRLARDREFAAYSVALAATVAALFGLLGGSSFVVIRQMGWTPFHYSLLYGLGAFGFILTGYANTQALQYRPPTWLVWRSVSLQALLAGAILLMSRMRVPSPSLFAILMTLFLSNLGFIAGNLAALAMVRARGNAGSGSAMMGVLQFAVSAAAGGIAAWIGGLPIASTGWTLATFSAVALISYCIAALPGRIKVARPYLNV
jgi:MFS transporter, DHA1 family, multidrug resistance protein